MAIEDVVNVNVTTATQTPTRAGFGTPLILAYHARWLDKVRSYTGPEGVAADGFTSDHPVYQVANAMFAQSPRPERIKVGRRTNAPAQVIDATPAAPAAGLEYRVEVDGDSCGYTAGGGDTLAAVCTALALAINNIAGDADVDAIITARASAAAPQVINGAGLNGVVGGGAMSPPRSLQLVLNNHADWDVSIAVVTGKNAAGEVITENFAIPNGGNVIVNGTKLFAQVTQVDIPAQSGVGGSFTLGKRPRVVADGSSGTKVVVTTTDSAAGVLVPFRNGASPIVGGQDIGKNVALFDATAAPAGITTDLDGIRDVDDDWYGLVLDSQGAAEIAVARAWTESKRKIFLAQSGDDGCADANSTTDILATTHAANVGRSGIFYQPSIARDWLAASLMAGVLPLDPGSETWAFKTARGVTIYPLTDTKQTAVLNKKGNTYTVIAGLSLTKNGTTGSGEFIDIVRGVDWMVARMKERVIFILANNPKLAYTDGSGQLLGGECDAVLQAGIKANFLAADPPPTVIVPRVSAQAPADRAARYFPGIRFSGRLAGAIHKLDFTGTVSA